MGQEMEVVKGSFLSLAYSEVHRALAPKYAPKFLGHSSKPGLNYSVYAMEYLPEPDAVGKGFPLLQLPLELAAIAGVEEEFHTLRKIYESSSLFVDIYVQTSRLIWQLAMS